MVVAQNGFFYNSPLVLSNYEGVIKYNDSYFTSNYTIEIQISLFHHPFFLENKTIIKNLTKVKTKFDNVNKYIVDPINDVWIISY